MWLVEPVSGRGFDPDLTPGPSVVYGVLRLSCSPLEPIRRVTRGNRVNRVNRVKLS